MKIAVIGCGWLGLPLLEALLEAGHSVIGTSRSAETLTRVAALGGQAVRLSLPDALPEELLGDINALIITLPPGGRQLGQDAPTIYRQRLDALTPLLQRDASMRVIYTSSTGVYGNVTGEVTETTPLAPTTHSGRAVVAAEEWLEQSSATVTILRLAGLIGPDRHPGRFYGGRSRAIPASDAPVNLVHRDDVISAIQLCLTSSLQEGSKEWYNVCAAAHPTKGRFYSAAAAELGLSVAGLIPGGEDGKIINSDKLRALGWQPRWDSLEQL